MGSTDLSREAACAAMAAEQYGLITIDQLTELGFSPPSIHRRLQAGSLIRILPRVIRHAAVPRSWHQRAMAVALWAGSDSAVCDEAAAALHRLDGFPLPRVISVVTARSLKAPNPLVRVKRMRRATPLKTQRVRGIPVTACDRTLVDIAGCSTEARLELALEDAVRRKLTTPEEVRLQLGRRPRNHAGRSKLLHVIEHAVGKRPTESALEVKAVQLLRAEGYPPPIRQEVLTDEGEFAGRVDLAYPERRLVIEVQGHRWHSGRRALEADRQRQNRHVGMGWSVLQLTSEMLAGPEKERFLRDLARAYGPR